MKTDNLTNSLMRLKRRNLLEEWREEDLLELSISNNSTLKYDKSILKIKSNWGKTKSSKSLVYLDWSWRSTLVKDLSKISKSKMEYADVVVHSPYSNFRVFRKFFQSLEKRKIDELSLFGNQSLSNSIRSEYLKKFLRILPKITSKVALYGLDISKKHLIKTFHESAHLSKHSLTLVDHPILLLWTILFRWPVLWPLNPWLRQHQFRPKNQVQNQEPVIRTNRQSRVKQLEGTSNQTHWAVEGHCWLVNEEFSGKHQLQRVRSQSVLIEEVDEGTRTQ